MVLRQQFLRQLQQHQGIVHSLSRSYFANEEDRKDAFQEIVLQLWKSYPAYRGDSAVSTWMYRVALNTIFNLLKQRRLTFATLPEQLAVEAEDHSELLRTVLSQLNPSDRALVILYLEGYSYQEIADIRAISLTNVSTRLSRIRQKLRSRFQSEVI